MDENSAAKDTPSTKTKRRGKYCAAFNCNNSYYDVDGQRTSYRFFKFPSNVHQRNRWCNLIKRQHGKDDFFVTSCTYVCSEHFSQEDILKKLSGRWELKKGKLKFLFTCAHGFIALSFPYNHAVTMTCGHIS